MKVEVKQIDGLWHAFTPQAVLTSAGINDIHEQVMQAWPPLPPGRAIAWVTKGNKLIYSEVDAKAGKLSKSNE